MWHNLTSLSLSPLNLIIRGTVVFLSVIILLRISGKRQMAQMSATEFVAILLISNAVQNSMNGGDNSLLGGLILAAALIFLSWLISMFTFRSRRARLIFEGTPTLLVHRGKIVEKHMKEERITHNELKVLLRKQGIHHFADIQTAVLEPDGTLSVSHVADGKDEMSTHE